MRRIAALAAALIVIVLLGVAQLALPGIAAQRLRDQLSRNGRVLEVQVSAFPAIELLWHHADRVVVRMASYRTSSGHLSNLLDQAADVGTLDASAAVMNAGLLTLREATLSKRGSELSAAARVTEDDLRRSVPFLDGVQPVASANGTLTLRGTATLFGVTATVDASVQVQDGSLVVVPQVPFGALATVTLFHDPRLRVQQVSGTLAPGGFTVAARGALG